MSDTNDLGDTDDFPRPARHPTDIKVELERLSTGVTNAIFEEEIFDEFALKFPEKFAYQIGEALAMLLGNRARRLRAKLLEGYDDGVDELIHDLEIEQDDGAAVNEDEFER